MSTQHHLKTLLLNSLDILPLPPQILLPQRDLVIPAARRQHVPAQGPADSPDGRLKVEHLDGPLSRAGRVARPDPHGPILRGAGDITLLQYRRRPGHVAHPVRVARQGLPLLLVRVGGGVERPDLEGVVRASCDKPPVACGTGSRARRDDGTGGGGGRPGD